jgi:hypothetical protein
LEENPVCHILYDRDFVESDIRLNRKQLSAAYAHVITELHRHGIEHVPGANAAIFIWTNLGKLYDGNITASLEDVSSDRDVGVTARIHK